MGQGIGGSGWDQVNSESCDYKTPVNVFGQFSEISLESVCKLMRESQRQSPMCDFVSNPPPHRSSDTTITITTRHWATNTMVLITFNPTTTP